MTITYDPRWDDIARQWLEDGDYSPALVKRYAPRLAQDLQDASEACCDDINCNVEDGKAAAEDAYWQGRIDKARGK